MDQETARIFIAALSSLLASGLTAIVAVTLTRQNHKQDHMKWLRAEKVKAYSEVQEQCRVLTNQIGKCLRFGNSAEDAKYSELYKNFTPHAFNVVASDAVREAVDAHLDGLQETFRWSRREGRSESVTEDERLAKYHDVIEKRRILTQAMRRDLDIPGYGVESLRQPKRRRSIKRDELS